MEHRKVTLPNGLRVLVSEMPETRSVSLAVYVGVGSRIETKDDAGTSMTIGPHPMSLVFNAYEVGALVLTGLVVLAVVRGGKSTRGEGGLLLALYVALGVVFALA